MNFGEKLRLLRGEKHLSQKEVAEKLHISLRTYASYELNKCRPRTQEKLKKLADFFGKTVDYLQIDDIENKIESLNLDSTNLRHFSLEFEKMIIHKIETFLNNLDWKTTNNNRHKFDLVATRNSTCIIFEISFHPELRRSLPIKYGHLCMTPLGKYEEIYYIIISNNEKTEEIVDKYQPINLTHIHVKGFSFNRESKDFYSNEIYKFISQLSQ